MARRRWRYDKEGNAHEIFDRTDEHHFVRGEIASFISPIDGTLIDSRTKYEDHCARHNVVPTEALAGNQREVDRYKEQRQDQAMREQMWEMLDRSMNSRHRKARG